MAEVKGIKETKDVMEFIFSFVDAIGKAKADDKFTWTDARYFIDPVKKLFEAVDNIEDVIPEITDIDDEEYDLDLPIYLQKALIYYVKAKIAEDSVNLKIRKFDFRQFKMMV